MLKDGRITIGSFSPVSMNDAAALVQKSIAFWSNAGKGHLLRSHTCSICSSSCTTEYGVLRRAYLKVPFIALQNRNDFGYSSRGNADFKHDSVVFEDYIHFKLTTVNLQTPTLLPLDA